MGQITSLFRKQETATAVLDRLESNIKELETDIRNIKKTFKYFKIVTIVLIAALLIWYGTCVFSWEWNEDLLLTIPLIAVPLLILYILRYTVREYYNWRLEKSKNKLNEMRLEKRIKLDEVRNTIVYMEAKSILDKYEGPHDELQPLLM